MKLPKTSVDRVVQNLAQAKLGDPRRQRRLERVSRKMARSPSASLPAALGGEAEVQGAYRLMNNGHVTFEKLMSAQIAATARRAKAAGQVIVIHDTSDMSFPHLDPREVGYLKTGKAGFPLHYSLVLEAAQWRRPLGIVHAETLHRPQRPQGRGKKKRANGNTTAKNPNREYKRWGRGMEASSQVLASCERVVHVADREGDSYELMSDTMATGQGFVFRVRVDRVARKDQDEPWSKVKAVAAACDGMLERIVPLSRRRGHSAPAMNKRHRPRKMRLARLTFAATTVEIPRPAYVPKTYPQTLKLHLVHVLERDPPPGEEPVQWLLYTTEPVDTQQQVEDVVDTYRARWTIEEFNSAIKTGCAYEDREFETRHALLTVLALSLPIACEMMWLRSRARSSPKAPATEVLSPLQIRILRKLGSYELSARPTANDALLAVAALGGHLKRNGEPGWKVLQRGMTLLHAYEAGWSAAQALARRGSDL